MKKIILPVLFILTMTCIGICLSAADKAVEKRIPNKKTEKGREIAISPPPFSAGIFPCTECHSGMPVNYNRRALTEEHANIVFTHDEKNRWCLDCHSAGNRDFLHLASGRLVSFQESYKLCGQCHGPKLRDWEKGVHGKRSGYWNGEKKYLLCVHCHNPHSPAFNPLQPMPPPVRQENIR